VKGLRGRLTLALAAASAFTVVFVGVLLLVPLDHKLRDDALTTLTQTARATRASVSRLHTAGPGPLQRAVLDIRRRTGAEALIVDGAAHVLAASGRESGDRFPEAPRAIFSDQIVANFTQDEAQVSVPFDAGGTRLALVLRRPLEQVDGAQDVVQHSLIAAGLVAVAVAAVLGALLAAGLARRLTALRETALRVSGDGEVPALAPDTRQDEIGDVSRAFATMQHRIAQQEQARRTFVSTASHELRTPLSSLRLMLDGAGEVLGEQPPDVAEARDQVHRALGQTERLTKLAGELLDLSRIDAGVPLRDEPIELGGLARSMAAEFPAASIVPAPQEAWVDADPGSVARILRILLDNARKHADHVEMTVDPGTITVRDDGPGVPAADAERIFERFERGSHPRDGAGFGLGLAIGRELARQMGGDLQLDPVARGASFTLALPVSSRSLDR
jgi:signal transduction histidine kinase